MALALGIDLGGTKVLAGLVDTVTGAVVGTAEEPTREEHGAEGIVQRIAKVAFTAVQQGGAETTALAAIGVGAAGQIDSGRGLVLHAPNLPLALSGDPLAPQLAERLGAAVHLFNDVEAAAAGEATYGAGAVASSFVVIFVGTGIGGAVYQEGKAYRGASNTAGEIGHTVVDQGGRICGCGGQGHLEAYASRTAIVQTILAELKLGRASSLANIEPDPDPHDPAGSRIGQEEICQAVRERDPLALEAIREAARYMGAGLVSLINFYNPELIIVGGGVAGGIDSFFELSRWYAIEHSLSVPQKSIEIVRARLDKNSGVLGAAVLAMRATEAVDLPPLG